MSFTISSHGMDDVTFENEADAVDAALDRFLFDGVSTCIFAGDAEEPVHSYIVAE